MRIPLYTKQFQKDIKRAQKRGKNLEKFKIIAHTLIEGKTLDPIHREHKLSGSFQGRCECHIESNWLLIYKKEQGQIIFERTGSHSDLFRF
ncbi:type II toxin-antitoxin system YafQ family toxin [Acidobacteriota bacterium]